MSEELINHYKADEREIDFLLFEQFKIQDLFESPEFSDFDEDGVRMILQEALKFAQKEIGPLNAYGDRLGCKHDPATNAVTVPPLYKELRKKSLEAGWHLLRIGKEWGGQDAPHAVSLVTGEFFAGACAAYVMYDGLSHGAAHLIEVFGTPEQRALYCPKMYSGEWMGTMCLTEPGAGSEVGRSTTKAVRRADGAYDITGVKHFISGGDTDFVDQIVHMVLARVEGAAEGTAGLSLFIIPKRKINPDGSLGESNDVICRSIEEKMGIHGSATCTLNYGDNGNCVGYLLGSEENKGMKMMFQMMNEARIGTGMQALATASSAYLNAVAYARTRMQGKRFTDIAKKKHDSDTVAIIEHEDIKRMILEMKSKIEGMRALAVKLALHIDRARVHKEDKKRVEKEMGYVELLVPLVKAYLTDQGFRVSELAIQTYGGYGYIGDYPVEQNCRDLKITSLYEGTNYIQSLDLVGRKLNMGGGALVKTYLADVTAFIAANKDHGSLAKEFAALQEATGHVQATVMNYMKFFMDGKNIQQIPTTATRFLEMLSELTLAWLLLEAAVIAHDKLQGMDEGAADRNFYLGKIHTARFFVRNILPGVKSKAEIIAACDTTVVDTTPDMFPSVA